MRNVSQWPNLRHLGESLGGAEGMLEAVSFKKATKGMGRGSVANARWSEFQTAGAATLKPREATVVRVEKQTTGWCLQSVDRVWECGN